MKKRVLVSTAWAFLAVFPATLCQAPAGSHTGWVEDSFEDFRDGTLDASGQNLYVSKDGSIRTIQRFDLNQDSYLDLVFNSTHDNYSFIPATVAQFQQGRQVVQAPLAVEGSTGVVAEDLNRDGHLDLVFCPNRSGVQHQRRFLTIL